MSFEIEEFKQSLYEQRSKKADNYAKAYMLKKHLDGCLDEGESFPESALTEIVKWLGTYSHDELVAAIYDSSSDNFRFDEIGDIKIESIITFFKMVPHVAERNRKSSIRNKADSHEAD